MSAIKVSVVGAEEESRSVLDHLVQLYLHDLSTVGGWDIGSDGRFSNQVLDGCWSDPRRHPFLIMVGDALAGFALVDRGSHVGGRPEVWDMAEFFVLNRWRRSGVGRSAARRLFARLPGEWEVRPFPGSEPAQQFWSSVCAEAASSELVHDSYRRTSDDVRPILQFMIS